MYLNLIAGQFGLEIKDKKGDKKVMRKAKKEEKQENEIIEIPADVKINEDTILEAGDRVEVLKESKIDDAWADFLEDKMTELQQEMQSFWIDEFDKKLEGKGFEYTLRGEKVLELKRSIDKLTREIDKAFYKVM